MTYYCKTFRNIGYRGKYRPPTKSVRLFIQFFMCVCACWVCVGGHRKACSSSHSPPLLQLSNYPVSMEKREDAWWRQLPWQPAHLSPTAWRTKHNKQLLVYTSSPYAFSPSLSVSVFSFLCVRFESVNSTVWHKLL